MKELLYIAVITVALTVVKCNFCDGKDGGYYCNPSDPHSFYRCHKENTYKFDCPPKLVFDSKTKICRWIGDCQHTVDNTEIVQIQSDMAAGVDDSMKQYGGIGDLFSVNEDVGDLFSVKEERQPNVQLSKSISSGKPQIVMLTFDDAVTSEAYGFYKELFKESRRNPDGCKIKSTFFVTGKNTDFNMVNKIHQAGHEIAVHTLSHRWPRSWWSHASYEDYRHEIIGMKERLATEGRVPRSDITGFRVPFLQLGGDIMYKVLEDGGFTHDSSMYPEQSLEPLMPFRMSMPDRSMCTIYPCPQEPHTSIWQFPPLTWYGLGGEVCSMADEKKCNTGDTLSYLKKNFERFYTSNRAPFPIYIHYFWLRDPTHLLALGQFIDELLAQKDVWFATQQQVVEWMETSDSTQRFPPWQCNGKQASLK